MGSTPTGTSQAANTAERTAVRLASRSRQGPPSPGCMLRLRHVAQQRHHHRCFHHCRQRPRRRPSTRLRQWSAALRRVRRRWRRKPACSALHEPLQRWRHEAADAGVRPGEAERLRCDQGGARAAAYRGSAHSLLPMNAWYLLQLGRMLCLQPASSINRRRKQRSNFPLWAGRFLPRYAIPGLSRMITRRVLTGFERCRARDCWQVALQFEVGAEDLRSQG